MTAYDLFGPALAPPAGVTADFDDPPNQNGLAWSAISFMIVVASICFVVRAYKCYLNRKVFLDDVLSLCAYLCFSSCPDPTMFTMRDANIDLAGDLQGTYWGASWAIYGFLLEPGFFVHQWNMKLGDTIIPYYIEPHYIFVFGVSYSVVLACIKIAIVVEWLRLFAPAFRNYFWWGAVAIIGLQAAFCVAAIFLLTFQCTPHAAIWDFTIASASCQPLNPLQLTSSTVHLFSDVAILVLPQKIIWDLNMSFHHRLGVAVVFGLGALAVVCSIFRLTRTVEFGASDDKMYTICPVLLWATAKMTIGFFVSGLVRVLLGTRFSTPEGLSGRPSGSGRGRAEQCKGRGPRPAASDSYTEINNDGSDGVAIGALRAGGSDAGSTKELRDSSGFTSAAAGKAHRIHVTRTTDVVVAEGPMDQRERAQVFFYGDKL